MFLNRKALTPGKKNQHIYLKTTKQRQQQKPNEEHNKCEID